jgi:hypothetical protein
MGVKLNLEQQDSIKGFNGSGAKKKLKPLYRLCEIISSKKYDNKGSTSS